MQEELLHLQQLQTMTVREWNAWLLRVVGSDKVNRGARHVRQFTPFK